MTMTNTPPSVSRRWICRTAAIVTVVMAGLVTLEFATGPQLDAYVLALVGTLVLGTLVFGGRLWRRNTFGSSLGTVVLAVLTIAGQTLVATVGAPGSTGAHWTAVAVAVVGCALVVLGLVAADVPTDAPPTGHDADQDHPYAL